MPRDLDTPLPRWARLSKKKEEKETALSMEDEEMYLRTRLHCTMAHRADQALQSALDSHVTPVVENIIAFFQIVAEGDDFLQERPRKRPRSSDEDPLLALFEMEPSLRYPVTMLPLATVHGPPSFLDRQEMMKVMVNKMKHISDKQSPAVCWLRSTENASIRHCGTFLQEILRQVL